MIFLRLFYFDCHSYVFFSIFVFLLILPNASSSVHVVFWSINLYICIPFVRC